MEFFHEAEAWVVVAFLLFVGLLLFLKVPSKLGVMLDARASRIASELAEAKKLREEAAALLASYQKKAVDAAKEAEDIVAQAKTAAEEYAVEARKKLAEAIERRSKQAEQKIAQAEAAAVKEVRSAATEKAIAAAARLAAEASKGAKGQALIAESIKAVKTRLN